MIIDRQREKLVEAVVYFANNMRKLGKTKLFKLLYFLDFKHYRETGRPVTGLSYHAWKMGPVPVSLFEELSVPQLDWDNKVSFREKAIQNGRMLVVSAHTQFDPALFSKRELRLLADLVKDFKEADAEDMVDATHLENLPWKKVWDQQKQAPISYDLALRAQDFEVFKAFANEREEFLQTMAK